MIIVKCHYAPSERRIKDVKTRIDQFASQLNIAKSLSLNSVAEV